MANELVNIDIDLMRSMSAEDRHDAIQRRHEWLKNIRKEERSRESRKFNALKGKVSCFFSTNKRNLTQTYVCVIEKNVSYNYFVSMSKEYPYYVEYFCLKFKK